MPKSAFESMENEYWYNVSPQDDLPLAGQIDMDCELQSMTAFFRELAQIDNIEEAKLAIANALINDQELFKKCRQFVGLSDKRAYLDLSYLASRVAHPSQDTSLSGCQPWTLSRHPMNFFLGMLRGTKGIKVQQQAALLIAEYLIGQGLFDAAQGFANMSADLTELVYIRLIAPKEFQQRAAKRRGHGCEAALAYVLEKCGVDLIPENKSDNPMGAKDPHLNLKTMDIADREAGVTHAFDMLIKNKDEITIAIQALIHTSDPGQYGVDKSNETVQIKHEITQWNANNKNKNPVELWGLVDGVGFSENKPDTINKLLYHFDHFIQLRTLYKAPLKLHSMGAINVRAIQFSDYYDKEDIECIRDLYVPAGVKVLQIYSEANSDWSEIKCGEAIVYI